ncbi:MAG: NAD(P)H-dependent glycerol-3-phosphate dehydrogenase [Eubacterium sp.]
MADICVLGGGGWAIAISVLLNNNGHNVTIWSAVEREVQSLNNDRENKVSLPGITIPETIHITSDLENAVKEKNILILAVASSFIRTTSSRLKGLIPDGQIIVNVAKGIEDSTLFTMTQVIESELPTADIAVLSGPSHAEEVGRGLPTTCVIGANTSKTAEYIQNIFSCDVFRTYISPDIIGIELGGSLKNVIALAAGMADGLGYGDNTKAAIITRGIKEITKLGVAMGGNFQTFTGLSGIGDLIVTCASIHSRNRRAGILIGRGYTLEEAIKEVNMVVEGVVSAGVALKLAKKYNVEMPIIEQVNKILFEGKSAKEAVKELMLREYRSEHDELLWNK